MELRSIGKVIEIEGNTSKLLISKDYQLGLKGLEDLDELLVVYWVSHPEEKPFYEEKGIFATIYTGRPNPLGIEMAEIVSVEDNLIKVNGLHARINADIIDLRPV
ncbi:MAG: SAM-dependent methyltransferase [Theionarchaea archaeon]|nr:SAM-dependent methyltransferase [Theionarchaea archaeon]